MSDLQRQSEQLIDRIRGYGSAAVALSGGVDSVVVASAAWRALGDRAVAVTGVSPSLAEGELEHARKLTRLIGIPHYEIPTDELLQPAYVRNQGDRCFHCKTELYSRMRPLAQRLNIQTLVSGTNADDLGDYRPGLQAAEDLRVESPLADCGFGKHVVRALAQHWQLPVWDKPAAPCLSSRVAYGEEVTPERLQMIDRAEQFLRASGLGSVRVRYHRGALARIEVDPDQLHQLCQSEFRQALVVELRGLGFRFVTFDLEGFRSGNLNSLLSLDVIQ